MGITQMRGYLIPKLFLAGDILRLHFCIIANYLKRFSFCTNFPVHTSHITQGLVVYAAKSNKVMYSITFVIFPVTKTIFSTRGCFSATLGLKMNIDAISLCTPHILRLPN